MFIIALEFQYHIGALRLQYLQNSLERMKEASYPNEAKKILADNRSKNSKTDRKKTRILDDYYWILDLFLEYLPFPQ